MLTVLIVAAFIVLAWPVVAGASRPASGRTRDRDAERRARFVARNPHEVNAGDIRRMLSEGGLDREQIERLSTRAAGLGIKPFAMLAWLQRFDAQALATVVGANLSQHELLAHITNRTAPDLAQLRVLAGLNDATLEVKSEDRTPARTVTPDDLLPPIASPHGWAMEDGAPVTLESLGLYNLPIGLDETLDAELNGLSGLDEWPDDAGRYAA